MSTVGIICLTLSLVSGGLGATGTPYSSCCTYCRGNQESWITSSTSWNISFEKILVTDFTNPAAYTVDEEAKSWPALYQREYSLEYGGIPLTMRLSKLSPPTEFLAKQYIQIDLQYTMDVRGIIIQGGFLRDINNDLFEFIETWVTEFLVSQSSNGQTFVFLGDQEIKTFSGNKDPSTAVTVPFVTTVMARYIRIHPMEARDYYGPVTRAILRVAPVVCTDGSVACVYEPLDCLMDSWNSWGPCVCSLDGCFQERNRDVRRYSSCGGAECEAKEEKKHCTLPESPLKMALIITFVILIVFILVVLAVFLGLKYKKAQDNKIAFRKGTARERKRAATAKALGSKPDNDKSVLANADEPSVAKRLDSKDKTEGKAKEISKTKAMIVDESRNVSPITKEEKEPQTKIPSIGKETPEREETKDDMLTDEKDENTLNSNHPDLLKSVMVISGQTPGKINAPAKKLASLPSVNEPPSPDAFARKRLLPEREEIEKPKLPPLNEKPKSRPKDEIDMLCDFDDTEDLGW